MKISPKLTKEEKKYYGYIEYWSNRNGRYFHPLIPSDLSIILALVEKGIIMELDTSIRDCRCFKTI